MNTNMKDLYQRVAAAVKDMPASVKAEIDAAFHEPEQPAAAVPPPIDYTLPIYGPTAQDCYAKNPSGLPPGWDWDAWWKVHPDQPDPLGRQSQGGGTDPSETGFALVKGGPPLKNQVTANVPIGPFTFTVPEGSTGAVIDVSGAPGGGWFGSATYSVTRSDGVVVIPQTTQSGFVSTGGPLGPNGFLTLDPGDYSMPLSVDGPKSGQGTLAVQYYP